MHEVGPAPRRSSAATLEALRECWEQQKLPQIDRRRLFEFLRMRAKQGVGSATLAIGFIRTIATHAASLHRIEAPPPLSCFLGRSRNHFPEPRSTLETNAAYLSLPGPEGISQCGQSSTHCIGTTAWLACRKYENSSWQSDLSQRGKRPAGHRGHYGCCGNRSGGVGNKAAPRPFTKAWRPSIRPVQR
jgi:hypothetical protein